MMTNTSSMLNPNDTSSASVPVFDYGIALWYHNGELSNSLYTRSFMEYEGCKDGWFTYKWDSKKYNDFLIRRQIVEMLKG